jgi:hypothetical protein
MQKAIDNEQKGKNPMFKTQKSKKSNIQCSKSKVKSQKSKA